MKKIYIFLALFCLIVPSISQAMFGNESEDRDPLRRINYERAFNPKRFKKFEKLMEHWGCAANALPPQEEEVARIEASHVDEHALIMTPVLKTEDHVPLLEEEHQADVATDFVEQERLFRKACLSQLIAARRNAILVPARDAVTGCCSFSTGAGVANLALGSESMGGSMTASWGLVAVSFYMRDVLKACCNWCFQPSSVLDALERRYALEQCFIPRALWPMIRDKFTMARTNQFAQRECIDFLEFALGLTSFKPKPILARADSEAIKYRIAAKIDNFFKDYVTSPDIVQLKVNVCLFIDSILGKSSQRPKPQYLVGIPGIGKSRFVEDLNTWLNQELSELVQATIVMKPETKIIRCLNFEKIIVKSPEELEGDVHHPGVFLRVLRNQLKAHKLGVLLFMDEATWLTHKQDNQWTSCANRVFNGALASMATTYFGEGSQGIGFSLDLPPMLVFTASNSELEAPSLISRFKIVHFPLPKKEALVEYALELFRKSLYFTQAQEQQRVAAIEEAIRNKIEHPAIVLSRILEDTSIKSFRDVENFVNPFVYNLLYPDTRIFLIPD